MVLIVMSVGVIFMIDARCAQDKAVNRIVRVQDLGSYEDKVWRDFMCRKHPAFAGELRGMWKQAASALLPQLGIESIFRANKRLRLTDESMSINDFKLDCDDQELRDKAESYAAGAAKH